MSDHGMEIQKFIIEYLRENCGTDALDTEFHDEFYRRFGGNRKQCVIGAQTVYKAQRWLLKMHKDGFLDRGVISLSTNAQMGFPSWVYTYWLREAVV